MLNWRRLNLFDTKLTSSSAIVGIPLVLVVFFCVAFVRYSAGQHHTTAASTNQTAAQANAGVLKVKPQSTAPQQTLPSLPVPTASKSVPTGQTNSGTSPQPSGKSNDTKLQGSTNKAANANLQASLNSQGLKIKLP